MFMKGYSRKGNKKTPTREDIIGLGEYSFKKNYYPELQQKVLDLERINSRNNALIKTIPDILLVGDLNGNIIHLSSAIDRDPFVDEYILNNSDIVDMIKSAMNIATEKGDLITIYFDIEKNENKRYFEARLHISEISEILIIIRDITERTIIEMQLKEMAEKDSLTGLYNRRCFEEELRKYNGEIISMFTVLVLDIDGLKLINDTLGHRYGDDVIVAVSRILKEHFDRDSYISRIGGDEFGIILNEYTVNEIESCLYKLEKTLQIYNDKIKTLKISISSGYSYHEYGIVNIEWMYEEADNYMYQNKLLKESSNRNSLVKALMKTLEVKDYITEGHAERMEELAIKMGEKLNLSQSFMDRLKLLAKFHDIGKVGIPDSILKKPGSLTYEEMKVMRTHCGIGERIASVSAELEKISKLILMHHEKWDGTGYPLGLTGDEIPIECRILGIVDAFDAMTNDRPYRKALSYKQAIDEIIRCSGTQFDPSLVSVFINLVGKN